MFLIGQFAQGQQSVTIGTTAPSDNAGFGATAKLAVQIAGNNLIGSTDYPDAGLTGVITLPLSPGERYLYSAVIAPDGDFGYFGTYESSGARIVKIDLASLSRIGSITLGEDEAGFGIINGAIDLTGTFTYWGTQGGLSPSHIVKVELSSFAVIDSIPLASNESLYGNSAVSPSGDFAYFGAQTPSGGILIRVELSTFTRVGTVTLAAGEDFPSVAVIDPMGASVYWGTRTAPGRVIKVTLPSFTRVGAITLNVGEDLIQSGVIDLMGGLAYFGTALAPGGRIVKVNLSTFAREDAVTLGGVQDDLPSAVIHPSGSHAYFGNQVNPGRVVALDLSDFSHKGTITLPDGADSLRTSTIDPAGEFVYFGTQTDPGIVVRIGLTQKNLMKATRFTMPEAGSISSVSFYSHAPEGDLRLGIYGDGETTRTLLWQSPSTPNQASEGWIDIPISGGLPPTLTLGPGTYYHVWQIDSPEKVPSFTPGIMDDGFYVPMGYGPFPSALASGTSTEWTTTSERWSGYLTYERSSSPPNDALGWERYR